MKTTQKKVGLDKSRQISTKKESIPSPKSMLVDEIGRQISLDEIEKLRQQALQNITAIKNHSTEDEWDRIEPLIRLVGDISRAIDDVATPIPTKDQVEMWQDRDRSKSEHPNDFYYRQYTTAPFCSLADVRPIDKSLVDATASKSWAAHPSNHEKPITQPELNNLVCNLISTDNSVFDPAKNTFIRFLSKVLFSAGTRIHRSKS